MSLVKSDSSCQPLMRSPRLHVELMASTAIKISGCRCENVEGRHPWPDVTSQHIRSWSQRRCLFRTIFYHRRTPQS